MLTVSTSEDSFGQIMFAGVNTYEILGFEPKELVGQSINTIIPQAIQDKHDA